LSFTSKLVEIKNKITDKLTPFVQNEKAEMVGMLKGSIIAIVALVVIVTLGAAILPGAIDTLSENITSTHPTWSDGTESIWESLAIFVALVFLLILVAVLISVLG